MTHMDTDEIRRRILLQILEDRFGGRKDGVTKLADSMGVSDSLLRRTLSPGKKSHRNIGRVLARRIEAHLTLSAGYLDNVLNIKSAIPDSSRIENATSYTAHRNASPPILGTTDKGCMMHVAQAVERIDVPSNNPEAYGLRVAKTIANRYLAGEVLLIEPNVDVEPGETVAVLTLQGEFLIRGLVSRTGDVITLCEIDNTNARILLRTDEIESLHLVAGCFSGRKIKADKKISE